MKRGVLVFVLCMAALGLRAQQNYDAGLIDKNLLPYARAVVRTKQVNIDVNDLNSSIYHYKVAITILNKNADELADISVYHDKMNVIRFIKGTVYNAFGIPTGKIAESAFEDINTEDGYSLFEDTKVKHFQPSVTDYPYTVEYEYEVRAKQSLYFEDWRPNTETGVAVESSTFSFTCKPELHARFKELNVPTHADSSINKDGLKVYTWKVSNLKAIRNEPYQPEGSKFLTTVKIAPQTFYYAGIKGSFTNWNELGKWIYDKLLSGRDKVLATTIDEVKALTANIDDPKLKAKKIYEYMQAKTRYVSVQIGIGGFQPFTAEDVDNLKYGDCKALVNYTQALLKAVNINSYYCVVMAGEKHKVSLLSDFASMNQANHIILCIPFKNDTTWADCTSKTIPFGYLGTFTDDRNVLACTAEGGKLLHTPRYNYQNNLQQRSASFVINNDGELSGQMTTSFKGALYEDREEIIQESKSNQIKSLQHIYPVNNMAISKLDYVQDKTLSPVTTERITMNAPEFAAVGNGQINFSLNPLNRWEKAPREVRNRATDIYVNDGFTDNDKVVYAIPAGYRFFREPLNVSLKTKFGSFEAEVKLEGDKLIFERKLQVIDGTYAKADYQDMVDFYQAVVDADAYNVTLVKKSN